MRIYLLFFLSLINSLFLFGQENSGFQGLVFNDTLNSDNTILVSLNLDLGRFVLSKELGVNMQIKSIKYEGKTLISEASIDGSKIGVFSNHRGVSDYFNPQFFSNNQEKALFKSIALAASSFNGEYRIAPNNSAQELIRLLRDYVDDKFEHNQLYFAPIEEERYNLLFDEVYLKRYQTTIFKIEEWSDKTLWEGVYLVNPNAIIESPSILNIKRPASQIKSYVLFQIIFWPEYFGISLNKNLFLQDYSQNGLEQKDSDVLLSSSKEDIVPIFLGCSNLKNNQERKQCFNQKLNDFIVKNLRYPDMARAMGIQGQVAVTFIIEKDGSVSGVEVIRGVDPLLDEEAMRIIKKLPKFSPARQDGKPVRMSFTTSINFGLK